MEKNSDSCRFINYLDHSNQLQLDHSKLGSEQTETTDISFFQTDEPRFDPIAFSVLSLNRFKSKVPDRFICRVCFNVVKDPQECATCEILFCVDCIYTIHECPSGCSSFEFRNLPKTTSVLYYSLNLTCRNQSLGCSFFSSLEQVLEHEEKCEFSISQCDNLLCNRYVFNPPKEEINEPLLCSEICHNLIEFSTRIDEENLFSTIKHFKICLEKCKKLAEEEAREELSQKILKINENRRDSVRIAKKKDGIFKEISVRQETTHPGKWNVRSSKWTCCGNSEVCSIGCKVIA